MKGRIAGPSIMPAWLAAVAQCQAPAPAPPDTGLKIVANTEEVSLDLVVRDKKGRPVPDLKPEDLEIKDAGKPVKLSGLRLVSGPEEAGANADAMAKLDPLRSIRLVTFVFERVGTDSGRLAREAANEMLKTSTGEKVYFSVLLIDRSLRLVQSFTADQELLHKAITRVTGSAKANQTSATSTAQSALQSIVSNPTEFERASQGDMSAVQGPPGTQQMVQMLRNTIRMSEQMEREEQARPTLDALLTIARQEAAMPGRKTVVYFCEGMRITMATKQMLRTIIGTANRANISFYTVDASGLSTTARNEAARTMLASAAQASFNAMTAGGPQVVASGGPPPTVGGPNPNAVTRDQVTALDQAEQAMNDSSQAPLMELAESTGGFYMGDTNDLRKPARKLMQDLANYYEANYEPAIQQYDGRYRSITVKALRRGLRIQARAGYFALPPIAGLGIQPFEPPMLKALSAAQLPNDFEFRTQVLHFGRVENETNNSLVLEVPLRELEFREDGTSKLFSVHFSVLALIKNQAGEVVQKFSQDIPYQAALEAAPQARKGMFTFERHFTSDPGDYTLEAILDDRNSGKMSARRFDCPIPRAQAKVGLSDMALVRRLDVFAADADPSEPFQYQNRKIVPNLTGTVSRDTGDPISTFFVIYPDAASADKPKLELEVLREGEPLGRVPMELPQAAAGAPIPYIASIPTDALRPGRYELHATVNQGKEIAERTVAFAVEGKDIPGAQPAAAPAAEAGTSPAAGDSAPEASASNPPDLPLPGPRRPPVVITSVKDPEMRPGAAEQARIIGIVRQHALDYMDALPNFTCIEITRRSVDPTGKERWRAKDSLTELLRYQDRHEWRATLEWNGRRSHLSRADVKGTLSSGEFGVLLKAVFDPAVKADFEWQEWAALDNRAVHAFAYRVSAANSKYVLNAPTAGGGQAVVGFHGLVYVDRATLGVRRITITADGVPAKFPIRESSIVVDYDYVAIGDHDHMMPVAAQLLVRQGKRYLVRNDVEFREYKRYGAASSIRFADPR